MLTISEPDDSNHFLDHHISLLTHAYKQLTGLDLVQQASLTSEVDMLAGFDDSAQAFYNAPFVLLSHNTDQDPIFNYANKTAQKIFEMSWHDFVMLPSRLSAEPVEQHRRQRLLDTVSEKGYINDYSGVRISKTGKRFLVKKATIWNIHDHEGIYQGQAAWFYL